MPTLAQIHAEINALPDRFIFYTRKEIRYLPEILNEGEHILALTSGFMENQTWLAICTTRRILFLNRGMIFGLKQVQINLDRLQSIESDAGLFFGHIRVFDSGSSFTIRMVLKQSIAPFVRIVQDAMDKYKREIVYDLSRAAHASAPAAPAMNKVSELERLAKLHDSGHLTDAEFAAAKARLLG